MKRTPKTPMCTPNTPNYSPKTPKDTPKTPKCMWCDWCEPHELVWAYKWCLSICNDYKWGWFFGSRKSKVRILSLRPYTQEKGIVRWKPDYPFLALNGIAKSGDLQNFSENSCNYPIYIKIYRATWPQVEKLHQRFKYLRTWGRLARDLVWNFLHS